MSASTAEVSWRAATSRALTRLRAWIAGSMAGKPAGVASVAAGGWADLAGLSARAARVDLGVAAPLADRAAAGVRLAAGADRVVLRGAAVRLAARGAEVSSLFSPGDTEACGFLSVIVAILAAREVRATAAGQSPATRQEKTSTLTGVPRPGVDVDQCL